MTVQNFVRIAWTVFDEMKRPKMAIRTAIRNFWANFGYVSQFQWYYFHAIARTGAPLGVE